MTTDELEFSISQYVDGTLPATEAAALERVLESDAGARALLDQYRTLDRILKTSAAPVEVQWNRLAANISRAIDEADERPNSYPMPWVRLTATRVAIAACIVLGLGVGIRMYLTRDAGNKTGGGAQSVAITQVQGPSVEVASAPPVAEITVGPAAVANGEAPVLRYADSVVSRPSRVIIASGMESPDTENALY